MSRENALAGFPPPPPPSGQKKHRSALVFVGMILTFPIGVVIVIVGLASGARDTGNRNR